MYRVQFYPSKELADVLTTEAAKTGVSVSQFVTDLLESHYGLANSANLSITQLTTIVLNEVEEFLRKSTGSIEFDLNSASPTYRNIDMTCGKKPSTVRASIGRSFGSKIGRTPFANVRKCIINDVQKLSANNALVYETFVAEGEESE